jgi:hypothetical protein
LVLSPVSAPFRTLTAVAPCATSRAALSVPSASDRAFLDEATLTNDPMIGKSIRLFSDVPPAPASGAFGAPLPRAGSPLAASVGPGRCSHVSPILRV